jgi:hypothetical protein
MYQKARNLEIMFIRHRLEILKNSPEQLIQEEISCLRAELKRKEELLNDAKQKVLAYEQSLKKFSINIDHQVKSRTEYNYMEGHPMGNMPSYSGPGSVR